MPESQHAECATEYRKVRVVDEGHKVVVYDQYPSHAEAVDALCELDESLPEGWLAVFSKIKKSHHGMRYHLEFIRTTPIPDHLRQKLRSP